MNIDSLIKDIVTRGGIAGMIAAIVMEMVNYPLYVTNHLEIRPIDFAFMVITHKQARKMLEIIAGFINHLFFASISGIILSYILSKTNNRFPILKGIALGLGTNIILLATASFFNIKPVINISNKNILLLDLSAAIPFGITLGYLLKVFTKKVK